MEKVCYLSLGVFQYVGDTLLWHFHEAKAIISLFICLIVDDSVSMPSVVSEQDAYLLSAIGRRRFSSHTSSMSVPQAEGGMLPSQR